MSHELDIIKNKIDSCISETMTDLNVIIENDDCLISKNDFQKLKNELYAKLIAVNDNYFCQYYMETTYNLRVLQYNIRVNITQDNELIARYILPFTLTIKPEDPINEKEICKKLIDLDWSLPEIIYEINEAHNLNMQNEFKESLSTTLTEKELDHLLSADFDKIDFANNYMKELYRLELDDINPKALVPDDVKCAIKEALNDDYTIDAACYDWASDTNRTRCYDYIINNYLNDEWENRIKKLTNMYTYALLTKL
jgi:hypothetical protein